MVTILEYKNEHIEGWSDFIRIRQDATVAHQIGWKKVIEEGLGHQARYILAMEAGQIVGVMPLFLVKTWSFSRYLISIPWIDYGGICAINPDIEKALLNEAHKIAKGERAQFIEFRSVNSYNLDLAQRLDKVTFILELDENPGNVWKTFDGKLRNQIRKSEKAGLYAETGGPEMLPDFYKVFSWKMRDLGTPVWGYQFFDSILKTFKGSSQIVLVKKEKETIAAGLVLHFKDRLYVPSAASYSFALKDCPNQALYWYVIKSGCEQKYKQFDFGRSTWNSNTFNFKKQWVKTPTQLTWQYYLNTAKKLPNLSPNSPKYKILTGLWRHLPLPLANYLGPKVIKSFP
jgi:serine/alanine adding enzyme